MFFLLSPSGNSSLFLFILKLLSGDLLIPSLVIFKAAKTLLAAASKSLPDELLFGTILVKGLEFGFGL